MSLAKTGQIQNVCEPNALMSLVEYALDYGDDEIRNKVDLNTPSSVLSLLPAVSINKTGPIGISSIGFKTVIVLLVIEKVELGKDL